MPFSSIKLKEILALSNFSWDDAGRQVISDGHKINDPSLLFEKIEDEKIELQLEKLKQ
jgi:methionyl-tRNA synthetase